jgi:hypothetical protein
MAGRYRGSRSVPEGQRAPWYTRTGRWLARRGYDLVNGVVPGTVFDYREHNTINPRVALSDGTVAETLRWARGRPEGMSDEDWARVQQEGREGLFDTAWQALPIPQIPFVTQRAGRAIRRGLLGPSSRTTQRTAGPTVVPTVSGGGVTTTERPVTLSGGSSTYTNATKPVKPANARPNTGGLLRAGALTTGAGGTRGRGVGVADDPADLLEMMDFSGGFGGVGYRGVTGGLSDYTPSGILEGQDLWNTVTGAQVLPQFSNGRYDAEHQATQSNRVRF